MSTMNQINNELFYKSNLKRKVIVNQIRGKANFQLNNSIMRINSTGKKLSKNGKMCLENSGTDIRLLADDDFFTWKKYFDGKELVCLYTGYYF
uniref:hypothetical protein n=2 Tax=unclassified Carnobacterium TaxID=257487 RepID=UPI0011EEB311|nr:hypothetical protein [Carnobacterium sp. PL26RED25]